MKEIFQQVLQKLKTEPLTIYYITNGRDREFGHTYKASFIAADDDPSTLNGLYYIEEHDMFYLRNYTATGCKTKRITPSQEDKISPLLVTICQEVVRSKQDLTFDRKTKFSYAAAHFFPNPKPEKKAQTVKKEDVWPMPMPDNERYLVIGNKRNAPEAVGF